MSSVEEFPLLQDNGDSSKKGMRSQEMQKGKDKEIDLPNSSNVETREKVADWRSLFNARADHALRYFPPQRLDGKIVVAPPQKIFEEGESHWKNTIVAQFIGRVPNFSLFQKIANVLWGKDGEVTVRSAGSNLFIIQLPNEVTRDRVLELGPWHIQNRPLIVRKWEPGLQSLEFTMDKLPVWIHLGNIPLELFTPDGLSYIASALGTPLYMDRVTASKQRLAFAKVCVEMEVTMEIPQCIEVAMRDGSMVKVSVDVPWYPQKCMHCSVFGHVEKMCPKKPVVAASKIWIPKQGMKSDVRSENFEGSMEQNVKGENKAGGKIEVATVDRVEHMNDSPSSSGLVNRFSILESVTEQSEYIEEIHTSNIEDDTFVEEEFNGIRKPRAAAAGVAELMRNLKPRKKGPIDKGKKQTKIGSSALRNSSSTSLL